MLKPSSKSVMISSFFKTKIKNKKFLFSKFNQQSLKPIMIHDLLEFLIFKSIIKNNIAMKCIGNLEEVLLGLFKNNLIVF